MRIVPSVSRRLVFLLGVIVVSALPAIGATTKSSDAGNYKGTDLTDYSFVDVAGSGGVSVLANTDDDIAVLTLPSGFNFKFFGTTYQMICVSSNGAAYFILVSAECGRIPDFANSDLASSLSPGDRPGVFPFWSDLVLAGPGAGVFYQAQGAPGSRRFIVQWNNAFPTSKRAGTSPKPVTFEVILFEGSNQILFQYKTVDLGAGNRASNGAQTSIGIHDSGSVNVPPMAGSGKHIPWSYKKPVVTDGTAILFTVGKKTPVMTAAGGEFTYDGSPHAGTGAAHGTLAEPLAPVSLSYEGASYPRAAVAPVDAGSYSVTATFEGSADYSAASQTAPLVIRPRDQHIVFTTKPPAAVVHGASYEVHATGGDSGNPVKFAAATPEVCGLDLNGAVHFTAAGTCTIAAEQAGSSNYLQAARQTQSFSVGKGTQPSVFITGPVSLQSQSQAPASASGGDGTGAYSFDAGTSNGCRVTNGLVTVTNASGTCLLTAIRNGDPNFVPSGPSEPFSVILGKTAQTIAFTSSPPASPVVQGANYNVSAVGGGSGNVVTFNSLTTRVCTVSGSTVSFTSSGTCQVAANQAGNNDYQTAESATQRITVAPATRNPSAGSNGAIVSDVNKIVTETRVSSNANPSQVSDGVVLTAWVHRGQSPVSAGTVTFREGATVLAEHVALNTAGLAIVSTSNLSVDTHVITATYSGTALHVPSTATLMLVVDKASTATTVRLGRNTHNQDVTFTATVRHGAATVTTGAVTFKEGNAVLAGPLTLGANGVVSFIKKDLSPGTHVISAVYSGSPDYDGSTGSATETVK